MSFFIKFNFIPLIESNDWDPLNAEKILCPFGHHWWLPDLPFKSIYTDRVG